MFDFQTYLEIAGAKPSSNNEWVIDCPWCGKAKHLYINTEPGESLDGRELPPGRWICFKCNERGIKFHRLMAELDGITVQEARSIMAKMRMGTVNWRKDAFRSAKAKQEQEQEQEGDDSWLPQEFIPVWDGQKWLWPKYLNRRGIHKATAVKMKLGVCRKGEYADRVIIPIVCPAGRSFTARTILEDEWLRYNSGPGAGHLLFGWDTIEREKMAVVVEGPFDALKVIQAGLPCVSIQGKQLRDGQAKMLLAAPRRTYVVMLDPEAGEEADKIAKRLGGWVAGKLKADPGDSSDLEIVSAFESAKPPGESRSQRLADDAVKFRRARSFLRT